MIETAAQYVYERLKAEYGKSLEFSCRLGRCCVVGSRLAVKTSAARRMAAQSSGAYDTSDGSLRGEIGLVPSGQVARAWIVARQWVGGELLKQVEPVPVSIVADDNGRAVEFVAVGQGGFLAVSHLQRNNWT